MTDLSILKRMGSTNERMREIFTSQPKSVGEQRVKETAEQKASREKREIKQRNDVAYKQNIEKRIRTRVDEGVMNSLKNYQFYAAADLAWDSSPVNKVTMPLILYAQGKVTLESAVKTLRTLPNGESYINKDSEGKPVSVDMPRFFECNINIIRSFITRRVAAQSNIFSPLYPFYKYEARTTGLVGKCRADVLSQRIEIMTDDYGYRQHDVQVLRDAFLYAHSLDFIESVWDVQRQFAQKEVAPELASSKPPGDNSDLTAEIMKEGVSFYNPHPSRVFWDNAYPMSSINTDTGAEFIGHWDVKRFRDIFNNTSYYNTQSIGWSTRFWGVGGIYLNYKAYFDNYCNQITPPCFPQGTQLDPAGQNERVTNIGLYSMALEDTSILVTTYFEKLIPRDNGIGDYPYPVWVRFIVASDATIIYAEFLPSTPAVYLGINENDSKQINVGVAHELMAYQDQLTNLFTEMLLIVQGELLKAVGINIDVLEKPQIEAIRKQLQGDNWSATPIVYEFSLKKLEDLKIAPDKVVTVSETRMGQSLTTIFEAIAKLVMMAEKLMAMSPAEQGQPAPREISATEVNAITSTTTAVYSFISTAVNDYRSAKKRLLYESLVCCAEGQIKVPVMDRYTKKTIEAAGFKAVDAEAEGFSQDIQNGLNRHTVIGTRRKLVHDYIFSSRDGTERAVNTQAANSLVQLLGILLNNPTLTTALGKEKLYEIVNEIFRLSGAGIDLNLELKPGEDNSLGQDQVKQFQQVQQQMQQALQQLAEAVQKDTGDIQTQKQFNQSVTQHFQALTQIAKQVENLTHSNARESVQISYKDMPWSVQAQAEKAAGFNPATDAERAQVAQVGKKPTK